MQNAFPRVDLLRWLGYRRLLVGITTSIGILIASFSLQSPAESIIVLLLPLFILGMAMSTQFTAMNTITLADLDDDNASGGNSVLAVTQQLAILTGEIGKALKVMGFSGPRAGQVVLTGGGAELAGMADFMQGALGMPVRLGKPPQLAAMPEAHLAPGFATLAGLCLYAAEDPVDIRAVGTGRGGVYRGFARDAGALALFQRFARALREYF